MDGPADHEGFSWLLTDACIYRQECDCVFRSTEWSREHLCA